MTERPRRDHLTPEQRSRAMKNVKLKDGAIEKIVQKELRSRGFRFQRHVRTLPGSPDIVLRKQRVAVFVDGDFWHGWRLPVWEHKLSAFWQKKLNDNRERDRRNFRQLRKEGWKVIRIWQHQLQKDREKCIERILKILFF
ncbi:MAG: very short patch repair endonuclease [Nitrospiraceae bacterium]|nr:very short patch repair endonuclease [Nitrospiraceae bacterium]